LSKCIGAQEKETELLEVLEEDTLPGQHRDSGADRHRRRELFEFWNLEEESTEGYSQGC
jgi:hypothetical protein